MATNQAEETFKRAREAKQKEEPEAPKESGPKRLEPPSKHVLYRYLRMVKAPLDVRPGTDIHDPKIRVVNVVFALDGRIYYGQGTAKCHPDDEHDRRQGNLLATRRAISDAWRYLPQARRDRIVRAMPEYKAAKARRKEERDARKREWEQLILRGPGELSDVRVRERELTTKEIAALFWGHNNEEEAA